jgi:hypothetical protein
MPVPLATGQAGRCDFLVTPALFDGSRIDLADLRLVDAAGRAVPHALRVRRPVSRVEPISVEKFNAVSTADGDAELTLAFAGMPGEYNRLTLEGLPDGYRGRVTVEGSEAADGEWKGVGTGEVAHQKILGVPVDVRDVPVPPSRFPRLRVRLEPGVKTPADLTVRVTRTATIPGEVVSWPVRPGYREPVAADAGPGSAWFLQVEGGYAVPWERLLLDFPEPAFARPYSVRPAPTTGDPSRDEKPEARWYGFPATSGELRRRGGEPIKPLAVTLPEGTFANRMRLTVTDFRNPPLALAGVTAETAARQVIFDATGVQSPLRLYFGNPEATDPRYDFAAELPADITPPPARLALTTGREANPEYRPLPKPLTERLPWLVYVVLTVAGLALAGLLGVLARGAIARADAAAA